LEIPDEEVKGLNHFTKVETWWVEECVKADEMAIKKAVAFEQVCRNPQLRQLCHQVEQAHRRHIEQISNLVGQNF